MALWSGDWAHVNVEWHGQATCSDFHSKLLQYPQTRESLNDAIHRRWPNKHISEGRCDVPAGTKPMWHKTGSEDGMSWSASVYVLN